MSRPAWICKDCGEKYGDGEKRNITWHEDKCDLCGKVALCGFPKDFGYKAKVI